MFCQSWDISQKGVGNEVSTAELAQVMLRLQALRCHNINLVTPSHAINPQEPAARVSRWSGVEGTLPRRHHLSVLIRFLESHGEAPKTSRVFQYLVG